MEVSFIYLCVIVIAAANYVTCECELNVTDNSIVKSYGSKLVLSNKYKNVVLVLGRSGDGVTTVTQWIAGDESKLKSREVFEDSEEYIIVDDDKIGTSYTESKTIFPELVVDKDTDTAYYDIPGFEDTRGAEYDEAKLYFIKRILDHIDDIKILLVVNYATVRKDDRARSLIKLLKHFTDLVKDIDKYSNGVGLVVNKVVNKYKRNSDNELSLYNDDTVMSNIAHYLRDIADELKQFKESETSTGDCILDDKVFCEKAMKTINSLLVSEDQTYKKIALLRIPDQPGPLKKIPIFQQEKLLARNMVSKNLQFLPIQTDDFCYNKFDF